MDLIVLNTFAQLIPTLLWWPIVYAIMKKITKKQGVSWLAHLAAIAGVSLAGGLIYNSFILMAPEVKGVIYAAAVPIAFSILAFFVLPRANPES
jgi:hypothetical protein